MDYGASVFIVQSRTTKNPILWNIEQALNQWHHVTPEHIAQRPINT